jgi:hypothetical protein
MGMKINGSGLLGLSDMMLFVHFQHFTVVGRASFRMKYCSAGMIFDTFCSTIRNHVLNAACLVVSSVLIINSTY